MPAEDATKTQTCVGECGRTLPCTREFFYYNPRSKTAVRTRCIRCVNDAAKDHHREQGEAYNAYQRQWRKDNPEAYRDYKLKSRYGITLEDYNRMLAEQGGGCAICEATESKNPKLGPLYVDHCHDTGAVRGLLCYHCNAVLGYMKDDPARLRAAIEYLERGAKEVA